MLNPGSSTAMRQVACRSLRIRRITRMAGCATLAAIWRLRRGQRSRRRWSATAAASRHQCHGTAAYGLLSNAVVGFYGVDANGAVSATALATARTGADGRMRPASMPTGPVVVAVTADAQTRMLDVVTGSSAPAPAALTLRAAVAGLAGNVIAVTPLTEMAFGIASAASGGLTVANIDARTVQLARRCSTARQSWARSRSRSRTTRRQRWPSNPRRSCSQPLTLAAAEGYSVGSSGRGACPQMGYGDRVVCTVGGLKTLLKSGASSSVMFSSQAAYLVTAYEKIDRGLVTYPSGQAEAWSRPARSVSHRRRQLKSR